jgi:hypothetical protein
MLRNGKDVAAGGKYTDGRMIGRVEVCKENDVVGGACGADFG